MGKIEEIIPRTAYNIYEKWDKNTHFLFPPFEQRKYTSFVDVTKMAFSEKKLDPAIDEIDINDVINKIKNTNL